MGNNSKDFCVEFIQDVKESVIIIPIRFYDKMNRLVSCCMLVDTGSTDSLLYGSIEEWLPESSFTEETTEKIKTIYGEIETKQVQMSFEIQKTLFTETFFLHKDCGYDMVNNYIVIGILGIDFFVKHGVTVDFANSMMYSFNIDYDQIINNTDYTLDMEHSIKTFKVPVAVMTNDEHGLLTILDSGAQRNIITKKALQEYEFEYEKIKEDTLITLADKNKVDVIKMPFSISYWNTEKHSINFNDEFIIIEDEYIIPPGKKEGQECEKDTKTEEMNPPVEAIISHDFMQKAGWILDFKGFGVYKPSDLDSYNKKVLLLDV